MTARVRELLAIMERLRGGIRGRRRIRRRAAEHVRMPALQLVADRRGDGVEIELTALARHLRMKHHLEQQIPQLVLEVRHVAAIDRIGDLVSLFDRVGRDAGEILLDVPRTARRGIAQARHDREQPLQPHGGVAHGVAAVGVP